MKRVFLTGGTGFIGAAIARRLIDHGIQIAILIRPESSRWRLEDIVDRVQVVSGSLECRASYEDGMMKFRPDTVMHLGWHGTKKGYRDHSDQAHRNVLASVDLLECAAKAGCRTFLGAGSQAEYGSSSEVIHEDSPTRPGTVYGAAKLATGVLLARIAALHEMRFAWLRIFSVYGPKDEAGTLVSYVVSELLAGKCPAVSTGAHLWDFLYVDDAAAAFIAIGESHVSGIVNIASGHPRPVREMIERLRDEIDRSLPVGFGAVTDSLAAAECLRAGISPLEQIGWRATTTIDSGVKQTVAWHREYHIRQGFAGRRI